MGSYLCYQLRIWRWERHLSCSSPHMHACLPNRSYHHPKATMKVGTRVCSLWTRALCYLPWTTARSWTSQPDRRTVRCLSCTRRFGQCLTRFLLHLSACILQSWDRKYKICDPWTPGPSWDLAMWLFGFCCRTRMRSCEHEGDTWSNRLFYLLAWPLDTVACTDTKAS